MGAFAYIHCRPDGMPFYVGKGALRRAKYFGERNPHHKRVVAKHGKENILCALMECSDDETAYELERGLITCLSRSGVKLTNFTAGGDGTRNPTPESRARMSAAAKKRGVSGACREASAGARRGRPLSPAQRELIRQKAVGRVFTEEHRNNISESAKLRGMSPATLEASLATNRGRAHSAEERSKRAVSMRAMWDRKGRKAKPPKKQRPSTWGATRPTRAVYVDDVWYPSLKAASIATGVSSSCFVHALKGSGVTHGSRVKEATHGN